MPQGSRPKTIRVNFPTMMLLCLRFRACERPSVPGWLDLLFTLRDWRSRLDGSSCSFQGLDGDGLKLSHDPYSTQLMSWTVRPDGPMVVV